MLGLQWSPAARRDLIEIWLWRSRDVPERGDRVLDRIERACGRLRRFPYLGPACPQIEASARKLSIEGYLALYRVDEESVVIVRVVDQRRRLEDVDLSG